jgi:hypothetical protein
MGAGGLPQGYPDKAMGYAASWVGNEKPCPDAARTVRAVAVRMPCRSHYSAFRIAHREYSNADQFPVWGILWGLSNNISITR